MPFGSEMQEMEGKFRDLSPSLYEKPYSLPVVIFEGFYWRAGLQLSSAAKAKQGSLVDGYVPVGTLEKIGSMFYVLFGLV